MSRLSDWLGDAGSGLTKIAARMKERRARAEERAAEAGEAEAAAHGAPALEAAGTTGAERGENPVGQSLLVP
ncbi:hypothetical protein GTY57_16715, partial [Streptomyces sp. SID5475]|nr:hypothetical protein [Streptomyces sp. SID5475]